MAAEGGPDITTNGLILNLDAGNPKSYPGSGNTWYDLAGGSYHATLYNSPTFGETAGVKSIICDGTNDWIGNTTLPGGHTDFTLELMFYHNGTDQNSSYGIMSMGGNGNYGPMIYAHSAGRNGHYFPSSPGGDYPGGMTSWSNLQWNVYTLVYGNTKTDSSTGYHSVYVNGQYTSGRTNYNYHNSGMGRGSNGYGLSTYTNGSAVYKGSYSQFRIYNRALSAQEIANNYNANRQRYGFS